MPKKLHLSQPSPTWGVTLSSEANARYRGLWSRGNARYRGPWSRGGHAQRPRALLHRRTLFSHLR
eukprot:2816633-Rhodomonas_salina.1